MTDIQQVRKGSTTLLILSILSQQPLHGYAIMRELESQSQGYFKMNAALLYPTLHQMEQDKLVEASWDEGKGQRRRKIYTITSKGQKRITEEKNAWQQFFENLFNVIPNPVKTGDQT